MVCIYCSSATQVTNSRHQKRANQVWRRRKCVNCGAIFSTTEVADSSQALSVNIDKSIQPFSRDILFISLYDSLKHRKDAMRDASALTTTIVSMLYPLADEAVVERDVVATISYTVLERFDKVAATHYKAFHPAN